MQGALPPFHREPTLKCPLYYVPILEGPLSEVLLLYFM